jgi:monothiol glutaredoxin
MSLTPELKSRIDGLLAEHRAVLFMKGRRNAPRCGFSATAVELLGEVVPDFHDVDVLEDPELREGIKAYGQWPTIPQLYVNGELIGGSDILRGMYNQGELHRLFGVAPPDRTPPEIEVSEAAAERLREAQAQAPENALHLRIDAGFRSQFTLEPAQGDEIPVQAAGLTLLLDLPSLARARGLRIDWVVTAQGEGLKLDNPNAPPPVRTISVADLKARLDAGDIDVIDVRPPEGRAQAPFAAARAFDADSRTELEALPRDRALAFLCHHGQSSLQFAEHFRHLGFREVYNVEGGIDAWSREIDPSLPRY